MKAKTAGRSILWVLVLGFVAWTAWSLAQQWHRAEPVSVDVGWLLLAAVPLFVGTLCQGVGWVALMQRLLERPIPRLVGMEVFFASVLGRYAPGKVGMPAVLMSRAGQLGVPAAMMGTALVLVVLVFTILGVGLGLGALSLGPTALLGQFSAILTGLGVAGLAAMAVTLVLLVTVDRRRWPRAVAERIGVGQGTGPLVGPAVLAWYTAAWAGWWAHGVLLVHALGGSWAASLQSGGLFVLAPVLGFLALVAPGGLGVREAVLATGLGLSVGPNAAVVAALASRIISLVVEVLTWAIFRGRLARQPVEAP